MFNLLTYTNYLYMCSVNTLTITLNRLSCMHMRKIIKIFDWKR